ncbi:MAG TPA: arabinan endo-1,5-alpha-L-arabinosidase [Polyangiaceae bacterium]|jgi:arabinan endo-1,5-alpha-L-arabinosidase|nr:arabinan endo-1,5-alpha-L-arabinosidase [Polyangiaceae bacterium]
MRLLPLGLGLLAACSSGGHGVAPSGTAGEATHAGSDAGGRQGGGGVGAAPAAGSGASGFGGAGGAFAGNTGTGGSLAGSANGAAAGSAGRDASGGRTGGAGEGAGGARAGGANGGATRGGATNGGHAGENTGGAAGASGGASGNDRCDVAVYDSTKPPAALTLSGNLGTHDPALIEAGGTYYLYATGDGVGAKTSKDLLAWSAAPAVFSKNPDWIAEQVPGATNLWAPDIAFFGGQYHLYYAASTFGSNHSCIGHATRAALDAGSFADHGSVLCSNAGSSKDDFNAIDPNVILDEDGTPWLAFGSFWSGIKLVELNADGTRNGTAVTALADRPANGGALEGAFIVRRCGYYYLFVSFGACCDTPWDYNVRVGRATSVKGPYADKAGTAMLQGGGTLLVAGNATWTAPGHNAVIFAGKTAYNVYHALNASHQNPVLRVAELAWDDDGWPISGGP